MQPAEKHSMNYRNLFIAFSTTLYLLTLNSCNSGDGLTGIVPEAQKAAARIINPQLHEGYIDARFDILYEPGGGIAEMMDMQLGISTGNKISPYDGIIREVSLREGHDWRLMAAIAYHESRFKEGVVSHKGAAGLMQIMPSVARQFNVSQEQITDPETNITIAAKLLTRIERTMKIPASVSSRDRLGLILASYNAGIGHVTDARRLAKKYGYNPNSWQDVSQFLKLKAEPEYYSDEVVRSGLFRGYRQTSAFVDNVLGKYNSYKTIAAL
jgi:membrane-bound lytic murein transglycosylase F